MITPSLAAPDIKQLNGFGLKLRHEYYDEILTTSPAIDWFEILTENYLHVGGYHRYYLEEISACYPLTMHGVSMSLGGSDPLDYTYLKALKSLANDIKAWHISDHLCWSSHRQINSHDLLPLPYTQETINHLAKRIKKVQDYLGRQILVENVSSYLTYQSSELTEWEFLSAVALEADCLLLLDINNVYVSAINHNFDPLDYLKNIPLQRVAQIHLAGHSRQGAYLIDTHDAPVAVEVWQLYQTMLPQIKGIPTLIERDENIPKLSQLIDELDYARKITNEQA